MLPHVDVCLLILNRVYRSSSRMGHYRGALGEIM